MDQENVRITVPGIKNALKSYKPERAICEYIWNGFDAGAKKVALQFEPSEFDFINEFRIIDDGSGIDFTTLGQTFRPFFESNRELRKAAKRKTSATHGKNGVGRLTFFRFARNATWKTVYRQNDEESYEYQILVDQETLNAFQSTHNQN